MTAPITYFLERWHVIPMPENKTYPILYATDCALEIGSIVVGCLGATSTIDFKAVAAFTVTAAIPALYTAFCIDLRRTDPSAYQKA